MFTVSKKTMTQSEVSETNLTDGSWGTEKEYDDTADAVVVYEVLQHLKGHDAASLGYWGNLQDATDACIRLNAIKEAD